MLFLLLRLLIYAYAYQVFLGGGIGIGGVFNFVRFKHVGLVAMATEFYLWGETNKAKQMGVHKKYKTNKNSSRQNCRQTTEKIFNKKCVRKNNSNENAKQMHKCQLKTLQIYKTTSSLKKRAQLRTEL